MRSLQTADLKNKTVLLRLDLDLAETEIHYPTHLRLKSALATLLFLLKNQSKIIILAHRGRPKSPDSKLSLAPLAPLLSDLLGVKVVFSPSFEKAQITSVLNQEKIILLENLRFFPGEESNQETFAVKL